MRYGKSLPLYLAVTPGITGLWQVMGRNDADYRRRVALDDVLRQAEGAAPQAALLP